MRKYLATLIVVMFAAIALGACGGGSKNDSADSASSDTKAASSDTTKAGSSDNGDDSSSGDSSDVDLSKCKAISTEFAKAAGEASAAFSGNSDDLDNNLEKLDDAVKAAPSEIRDDLKTVISAYRDYVKALKDSGYDPSSGKAPTADQLQKLQDLTTKFDDADFKEASDNLTKYFNEKCGGG